MLYDDSAPREAPEAYAASRGVVSSEQYSSKKELRRALHGIMVLTAGVFSNTLMSPVEHSRKHRQRTGPRKKGARTFLEELSTKMPAK